MYIYIYIYTHMYVCAYHTAPRDGEASVVADRKRIYISIYIYIHTHTYILAIFYPPLK